MSGPADDDAGAAELAARARLAAARIASFATASPQGQPHIVPFCFVVIGDAAYSVVDDKQKKTRTGLRRLANIRENPKVSLLADGYDEDWSRLWLVRADGDASLVEDEAEYGRALAALREKYPQYCEMTLARGTHP